MTVDTTEMVIAEVVTTAIPSAARPRPGAKCARCVIPLTAVPESAVLRRGEWLHPSCLLATLREEEAA